ncbi:MULTISPECIES: D-alanine--D-alanine ligase [Helicobacter]|uniref:D-alanine--D-alanine ligase n=1 Tax=Helicobacter TaxID=209 RepID=UPI000EAF1AFA|nr:MULTISPECIES: D-alanine--D-alanine ligase [Helicobacter]
MVYGVLFGGRSYEHEISIVSAIALKEVLGAQIGHFIFLDGARRFYLIPTKDMRSNFFASHQYKKCPELVLKPHGFYTQGLLGGGKQVGFSTLINLVHGGDGEDGLLASLLDFFEVPFIGPRVEACVVSYSKYLTKSFALERAIKVLPYVFLTKPPSTPLELNYPLIVKPNRLGSSIGIKIAKESKELDYALDEAFEFDSQVVLEPFKAGVKEYNLAGCMLENGEYLFSIVEEPQKKDLLGFEEKYLDFGRTQKIARAQISAGLEEQMRALFKRIYEPFFIGALIRCDFFVLEDQLFLNEINPIPGSLAHYLFGDFTHALENILLPKNPPIPITYRYINQIQKHK